MKRLIAIFALIVFAIAPGSHALERIWEIDGEYVYWELITVEGGNAIMQQPDGTERIVSDDRFSRSDIEVIRRWMAGNQANIIRINKARSARSNHAGHAGGQQPGLSVSDQLAQMRRANNMALQPMLREEGRDAGLRERRINQMRRDWTQFDKKWARNRTGRDLTREQYEAQRQAAFYDFRMRYHDVIEHLFPNMPKPTREEVAAYQSRRRQEHQMRDMQAQLEFLRMESMRPVQVPAYSTHGGFSH